MNLLFFIKIKKMEIKFTKIREVKTPNRGTIGSAGIDFFVPNDFDDIGVMSQNSILIKSGIKCKIPKGFCLIAFNKSGIASKGLSVGACVIDEDYQGEILFHLFNHSNKPIQILKNQKIIQLLLMPVYYADLIEIKNESDLFETETQRGQNGFGSTKLF